MSINDRAIGLSRSAGDRDRILFSVDEPEEREKRGIVQIHRVLRGSQERLQNAKQLFDGEDD